MLIAYKLQVTLASYHRDREFIKGLLIKLHKKSFYNAIGKDACEKHS